MTRFRSVTVGDRIWLAVEGSFGFILLHPQARVGARFRPGQRLRA